MSKPSPIRNPTLQIHDEPVPGLNVGIGDIRNQLAPITLRVTRDGVRLGVGLSKRILLPGEYKISPEELSRVWGRHWRLSRLLATVVRNTDICQVSIMQNLIRILIGLAIVSFVLAVTVRLFTGAILETGAAGYSHACTNLALLAIAIHIVSKAASPKPSAPQVS